MDKIRSRHIISFLKLIRIQNLIIVAATQYLVRWCIFAPILKSAGLSLQLNELYFLLLVLSTVFITSAGYVINDYFDRKSDLINKPESVIVGKEINRRIAMAFHIIFNIIGVAMGTYISFKTGEPLLSLIFIAITGLLWFYSTIYKKQLLIGNIIVALLTAMVPLIIFLFEFLLLRNLYDSLLVTFGSNLKYLSAWVSGYAGFAFLLTLAREIIKDTEDFKGDYIDGSQTLPIVVGVRYTKAIITVLFVTTIIALLYVYLIYLTDTFTLLYILITLVIPLAYIIYRVITATDRKDYSISSVLTKIVMVSGLLYALLANCIIPLFF